MKIIQKNYIEKIYGRLTILFFSPEKIIINKNNYKVKIHIVTCQCSCGNLWTGMLSSLKSNTTQSCGCLVKEDPNRVTHGLRYTIEYQTWCNIKSRCYNTKNKNYKNYGKKGIIVCNEWKNSFEIFLKDMGKRPSKQYSIDRINNNLGYFKENCKWSTAKEQNNNRGNYNHFVTYKDKTQTLAQWCNELNLNYDVIKQRINSYKWSIEKSFETSIRTRKKH